MLHPSVDDVFSLPFIAISSKTVELEGFTIQSSDTSINSKIGRCKHGDDVFCIFQKTNGDAFIFPELNVVNMAHPSRSPCPNLAQLSQTM